MFCTAIVVFYFMYIVVVVYKELIGFVSFVVFTAVVVFVVVVFTVVRVVFIVHHIVPGGVCHSWDAPLGTVPPNIQKVGQ